MKLKLDTTYSGNEVRGSTFAGQDRGRYDTYNHGLDVTKYGSTREYQRWTVLGRAVSLGIIGNGAAYSVEECRVTVLRSVLATLT